MRYFIFDFNKDSSMVESFLHSASLAHNQPAKTKDWFFWKFRDNPFGEAVLACVENEGQIVGCVAYGMQYFTLGKRFVKGAISFETFVHPNFQGQGVFSKLLNLAEVNINKLNIELLLNFPNSNSLKGFLNKGWKDLNVIEYWIQGRSLVTIPFGFLDLKKGFHPNPSNFEEVRNPKIFKATFNERLQSLMTIEYLNWRFFTFPNAEYYYIENDIYDAICRVGTRGKLKEAQVLFVNIKKPKEFKLIDLQNEFQKQSNYDVISFPISKTNSLRKKLKNNLFIKVPNNTNVCFKILNDSITKEDVHQVSLNAINFHTY
ncbi:GNAT family N-acetyltransferase [Bizionia saleffrena]|uniref:GNAT family N-acetyltransferase n=1 Tax=Bizionia saleffrena TaxID=291189 RepID=A0A8H2LJU4_9FLAO|nr:GNAT family N-acetyltransferase [Bizionia saleffrena]TYB69459.1 GNAT family N-acetyltransferase [Bizionia saleffrena]